MSAALARSGIEPEFVRGLRVTDAATLDVVVGVLVGLVNKQLVAEFVGMGVDAIGLSGADEALIRAGRYDDELGFVGRITSVDGAHLDALLHGGSLPVIAPIAIDAAAEQLLNTNADTAAGEVAAAIEAKRMVFLTDVPAVLDGYKRPIARMTAAEARALIDSGAADGGMIPKLEAAIRAAAAGCSTRIIDGTQAGALARALAGEEIGTTITG